MKFLKLLKYEIMENLAPILLINGVLLFLILLIRLSVTSLAESSNPMIIALWIAIPIGIFASIVFLIITIIKSLHQRLFSKEGYLTLSLPVGIDAILVSKILASLLWIVLTNIIVALFIIFIMGVEYPEVYRDIYSVFSKIFSSGVVSWVFLLLLTNLLGIISLISLVLFIISILNIGKINRFKVLSGILIFLLFLIIESIILGNITGYAMQDYNTLDMMRYQAYIKGENLENLLSQINSILIKATMPYFIFAVVSSAFYYLIARYLIKNKLEI